MVVAACAARTSAARTQATPRPLRTEVLCQRARRSARRTKSGRTELSRASAPLSVTTSVASSVSGIEVCCPGTGRNRSARRRIDAVARTELAGGLRLGLRALARPEQMGIDRVGEQLAEVRFAARRRRCGPRRIDRPRRLPRRRAAKATTTTPPAAARGSPPADRRLFLPVGRRVAAEVEEPFKGIEDGVAATAAHPAFGHLELVLDDSKRRPARGAARRQTHRQIMPCGERRIACRREGSSRRPRRRRRDRARARRRCAARRPGARARPKGPAGRRCRPMPTAPARAA